LNRKVHYKSYNSCCKENRLHVTKTNCQRLRSANRYRIYTIYEIYNINWNKLQEISEAAITTLSSVITQIPGISSSSDSHAAATASSLAMTSLGIPFTGSIPAGFTIGFMKG
jgi:hypothetical protein